MTATDKSIRDEVEQLDGFEVFDAIAAKVLDHFGYRPLCDYRKAEVADPIIRAVALRRFANEVESGCIHQYLYNCGFDEAVYAKESLDVIGEHRLAKLLAYAIPLMSDNLDVCDESWQQAAGLTRNPKYRDVEADFREAYDLMARTFYDSYAAFIKANLDTFTEFDDPQTCQSYRERFPLEIDLEAHEACLRAARTQHIYWAWHTSNKYWLIGAAFVGIMSSIVAFVFGFGLGCVTSLIAALVVVLLYCKWRP